MRIVSSTKPALPPRKVMLETLIRRLDLVRLTIGAVALTVASGCVGLIDESDGVDPTVEQRLAKKLWETKAYPILSAQCTASCHGSDPTAGLFLQADDLSPENIVLSTRDKLLNFDPKVVNLETPKSSRILTKGLHKGPELSSSDLSDLLEWVLAEQDATPQPGDPGGGIVIASAPIMVTKCAPGTPLPQCPVNEIDLATVPGANLAGSKVTFKAPSVGTNMLYVTELTLVGGATGAYMEHPLFVAIPPEGTEAEPVADPIDRYFAAKFNANVDELLVLDGGAASFNDFPDTYPVELHFKIIEAYRADGGMPGGPGGGAAGCKDVPSFTANAAGPFNQNCASCHLAGDAKAAMDLTGIANTNDVAAMTAVCGQIKTRANLTTPDLSSFFVAPAPANQNHPFRFANDGLLNNFKTPINIWIEAEKVAP